ncbi:MAG: electron transfer flavoprotein alpha/ beta subunit [Chloroflexi bacterium]|nr:electron transfer flavoprotein alpha/ beta subunit [Chloroflexota bacterium]
MRLIVCLKQVPSLEQMKFDDETKRLIRDGVSNSINTFDRRAITEAIRLKEQFGGEVVAVTMGPPQAADALKEALMMGCDRAVHLLGREFAGADTLATARTLAMACRKIGFDLIFCGKTSTDAETAQVPPMLAEFLSVPQVTGVTELQCSEDRATFRALREVDDGFEWVECPLPAVLSAAERLNKPIRVGPADAAKADGKPFEVWTPQAMHDEMSLFGLPGSPTWVERIYSIEPVRKRIMLDSTDLPRAVRQLTAYLRDEGWGTGAWKSHPHVPISLRGRRAPADGAKAIWVVAETAGAGLRDVTLEMLGEGIRLTNQIEGELAAVLIGHQSEAHVQMLAAYGADRLYVADAPVLEAYTTDPYADVLARAIQQHRPFAVLLPSTANGRDLAPRVAARLGIGLTGDAIGLEIDAQGRLVMLKPAFGGNIIAPILSKTLPAMATLRPGMLHRAQPDFSRRAAVVRLPTENLNTRTRVAERIASVPDGLLMDDAEIIVGVGVGIGGPENLPVVKAFADQINASLSASRKVVDSGWMPRQFQVGLTGRAIAPRVYFALGTSGQFNHTVGIQRAGIIVAINNNPDAPIFKHADYGIVAGWREFIEAAGPIMNPSTANGDFQS